LLSVPEVAVALGIGRSLLYGLLLDGQIRSIKVGRARRIPPEAIEEFVARKSQEAADMQHVPLVDRP
jgi:excisionase family DNA binding protein